MDCVKCGSPMYHPSPSKLCPQCEGEALDKWIAEQEAAQQSVQSDFCPRCGGSKVIQAIFTWVDCPNCVTGKSR